MALSHSSLPLSHLCCLSLTHFSSFSLSVNRSLSRSFSLSLVLSLARSLSHPLALSLSQSHSRSLSHPLALSHTVTLSLFSPPLVCLTRWLSLSHSKVRIIPLSLSFVCSLSHLSSLTVSLTQSLILAIFWLLPDSLPLTRSWLYLAASLVVSHSSSLILSLSLVVSLLSAHRPLDYFVCAVSVFVCRSRRPPVICGVNDPHRVYIHHVKPAPAHPQLLYCVAPHIWRILYHLLHGVLPVLSDQPY